MTRLCSCYYTELFHIHYQSLEGTNMNVPIVLKQTHTVTKNGDKPEYLHNEKTAVI